MSTVVPALPYVHAHSTATTGEGEAARVETLRAGDTVLDADGEPVVLTQVVKLEPAPSAFVRFAAESMGVCPTSDTFLSEQCTLRYSPDEIVDVSDMLNGNSIDRVTTAEPADAYVLCTAGRESVFLSIARIAVASLPQHRWERFLSGPTGGDLAWCRWNSQEADWEPVPPRRPTLISAWYLQTIGPPVVHGAAAARREGIATAVEDLRPGDRVETVEGEVVLEEVIKLTPCSNFICIQPDALSRVHHAPSAPLLLGEAALIRYKDEPERVEQLMRGESVAPFAVDEPANVFLLSTSRPAWVLVQDVPVATVSRAEWTAYQQLNPEMIWARWCPELNDWVPEPEFSRPWVPEPE